MEQLGFVVCLSVFIYLVVNVASELKSFSGF